MAPISTGESQRELTQKPGHVILNVGGTKFEPYNSTLRNIDLPLAWILSNKQKLDYDPDTGEFFFDRHPAVFAQVLNYFQTGKLHCPRNMCGPCFEEELAFWGIDEQQMESCCWPNYTKYREAQESLKACDFRPKHQIDEDDIDESMWQRKHAQQDLTWWQKYRPVVWDILDRPYSSRGAKVFSWITMVFIVVSVACSCLWTLELFNNNAVTETTVRRNVTKYNATSGKNYTTYEDITVKVAQSITARLAMTIVDAFVTAWFTLEFILRLIFCPDILRFWRNCQNWIDLIVLLPVYFFLIMEQTSTKDTHELLELLNTIRILRVFRFFKCLYDLQILGKTMNASRSQLLLLLFVLLIPVILFSTLVYFTEIHWGAEKTKALFTDIPSSSWWGIVTMTTIGYGDLVPTSIVGQLIGGMTAICGVMIVSMSASVIGSTFSLYYNLAQTQMKLPQRRRTINVEYQTLAAILSLRGSETTSTVTTNISEHDGFKTPNRHQGINGHVGQPYDSHPEHEKLEAGFASLQARKPPHSPNGSNPLFNTRNTSYPKSSQVQLVRKASIRRESILV